jgi:hypothetical protein
MMGLRRSLVGIRSLFLKLHPRVVDDDRMDQSVADRLRAATRRQQFAIGLALVCAAIILTTVVTGNERIGGSKPVWLQTLSFIFVFAFWTLVAMGVQSIWRWARRGVRV